MTDRSECEGITVTKQRNNNTHILYISTALQRELDGLHQMH